MKHTIFFIFLVTNIVSAAMLDVSSGSYRWDPYSPGSSQKLISPRPLRLPPAATIYPIEYSTSVQALTDWDSASDRQTKPILTEIEILSNRQINSLEFQQYCIHRLIERVNLIDSSIYPLSENTRDRLFESFRTFLNREYYRLGQGLTTNTEQWVELRQQYQSILMFCDEIIILPLFSTEQIEKLRCYNVSFLIGTANVCGYMKDNTTKKDYFEQALAILNTFTHNVNDPYGDGTDFILALIRRVCTQPLPAEAGRL